MARFARQAGFGPYLIPVLLLSSGCVSLPIGDLPRAPEAELVKVLDPEYMPFRVAPNNRYALVMSGRVFAPPEHRFAISSADDVLAGKSLDDPWVRGDTEQLTKLLLNKGYDVYQLDFGQVTPRALEQLLGRLAYVSNEDTHLFFAYSGEGDSRGLRTRTLRSANGGLVVPPGVTVEPKLLFSQLARIRGRKALLINSCEAGIFAEEAPLWSEFAGVVITACRRGFATTPHEPSGTTAIFAAFLDLYGDDPQARQNLATVEIERAGGLWTNLAHHWQAMWGSSGLPISYEPLIYVSEDYWF
jgi:hypothetical protein